MFGIKKYLKNRKNKNNLISKYKVKLCFSAIDTLKNNLESNIFLKNTRRLKGYNVSKLCIMTGHYKSHINKFSLSRHSFSKKLTFGNLTLGSKKSW